MRELGAAMGGLQKRTHLWVGVSGAGGAVWGVWRNWWVGIYSEMPNGADTQSCSTYFGNIKHWQNVPPLLSSSKSIYFKNRFPLSLFIATFCSVAPRNRMENHNVTLVKLTLQGSATGTCTIPRGKKATLPGSRWEYDHGANEDMQICLRQSSFA